MSRSRSSHRDDKDRDRKSERKSHQKRSSSSRRDRSQDETEEERLLRKAKEFVDKEKRKKSSSRKEDSRRSRSPSDKKRSSREDDRKSSKRNRHSSPSSDDEDDDIRHHKSRRKSEKSSSSRKRSHSDSDDSPSHRDRKEHSSSHNKEKSKKDDRKHKHKKDEHKHSRKKEDKKESKKDKKKKESSNRNEKTKPVVTKPDKSKLTPLGSPPGIPPSKFMDQDDYFSYHQSLWVWLYREEGIVFNDLTSEESRDAFARFVKEYNAGKLEAAYYDEKGLPPQALEECKTTRHKWTFQTSETERKGLQMLQDGVRKLTEYADGAAPKDDTPQKPASVAPRLPTGEDEDDHDHRRTWTTEERLANRVANKRLREHARTAEEEFSGGRADYGRERQLEKKREVAAKIHGAARDREDLGVALSDDALYGDGGEGSSFQAALARERKRKAQREESQQTRIQELQQKEQDKQKAMLDMLGLAGVAPGQRIKIAPRKDN